MPSLRLQHLQWAGGLAVVACCGALAVLTVLSSLADYRNYDSGVRQLERLREVMDASNALSAERAPTNTAMTTSDETAAEAASKLAAARENTDRKLDRAEGLLLGGASSIGLRGGAMDEVRIRLAAARRTVDMVVATPKAKRSGRAIEDAILAMFSAADEIERARDALGRTIISAAPQIGAEVFLSIASSSLRDAGGRVGSYVVMILAADVRDDDRLKTRMLETAGRVRELRHVLANYASAYFLSGPVETGLKQVEERFFLAALPAALDAADAHGRGAGMSPTEFTKVFRPALKPIEELREAVAAASRDKLESLRADAGYRLIVAGSLIAAICAILAAITLVFRRTLFAPLLKVRDQVVAIAQGDLDEPPVERRVSREITDMMGGLVVLRAEQRRKLELEREQRRMARQLLMLSQTDALTHLMNRRAIEEAAARELAHADMAKTTVALVMFDVDHFKSINDTYGHAVGDAVLKRLAQELGPKLRPGDLFARFGGEEFVVLLPSATERDAQIVAERLCDTLSRMVVSGASGLRVTASFGVAVRRPKSGMGWETLVMTADRRLYAAKAAGRNRVVSRGGTAAAA